MRTIILFLLLFTTPAMIRLSAQDCCTAFQQETLKSEGLRRTIQELNTSTASLNATIQQLENDKKQDTAQLHQLVKENERINQLNTQLTSLNASQAREREQHIDQITKLQEEVGSNNKNKLKEENENLKKELIACNKTKSNTDSLVSVIAGLKSQNLSLEAANQTQFENHKKAETLSKELNANNLKLQTEKGKIQIDSQRLANSIQIMTVAKDALQVMNHQKDSILSETKSLLTDAVKIGTEATLKSTCYDVTRAAKMMHILESIPSYPDQKKVIADLNQYIELAGVMEECEKVLFNPYNHETTDNALRRLTHLKTYCSKQVDDISSYKQLLENYCTESQYASSQCKAAALFMPNFPTDAKKKIQEALSRLDDRYQYLDIELKKNAQNPSRVCKIPSNCM